MKNIQSLQSFHHFHHHLEQFKTSVDVVINQEHEYEQNYKRYAIKEIELKQKEKRNSTGNN